MGCQFIINSAWCSLTLEENGGNHLQFLLYVPCSSQRYHVVHEARLSADIVRNLGPLLRNNVNMKPFH